MLILGCVVWIFGGGICQTTERCEESCGTDRCGNFLPGPPLSLKLRNFSEIRPHNRPSFPYPAIACSASTDCKGEWGITSADVDPPPPEEDISQIRELLALKAREFRVMISVLLTDLAYQGDTEMRFLGIRLNYNEVLIPGPPKSCIIPY